MDIVVPSKIIVSPVTFVFIVQMKMKLGTSNTIHDRL